MKYFILLLVITLCIAIIILSEVFILFPIHPFVCSLAVFATIGFGFMLWSSACDSFGVDKKQTNVEYEKLKIVHEFRKLHEAEYLNFVDTVNRLIESKKE